MPVSNTARMSAAGDVNADPGALMGRIARGDESAFAELYDLLAPTVYGVVLRIVRDRSQAEEVTQEAFVEVWRQAARFDGARGGVRGWAVTIARRRAVDRVRSEQSRRERQHRHAAMPAGAPVNPQDAVIASLDRDRARRVLDKLGDHHRQALELAYFDGLTHVEVAEQLGVALGTAKTRIRDGLLRLRTLIEAHA
jgi:RNA polymerase sigma-70 factor (ECF subfamily)